LIQSNIIKLLDSIATSPGELKLRDVKLPFLTRVRKMSFQSILSTEVDLLDDSDEEK